MLISRFDFVSVDGKVISLRIKTISSKVIPKYTSSRGDCYVRFFSLVEYSSRKNSSYIEDYFLVRGNNAKRGNQPAFNLFLCQNRSFVVTECRPSCHIHQEHSYFVNLHFSTVCSSLTCDASTSI